MQNELNANWIYELLFGRGRHFGTDNCFVDALVGNWSFSGLAHWTSGLPFSIFPGGGWSTNFNLRGEAVRIADTGSVGTFTDSTGAPNMFQNPTQANAAFRRPFPGEGGQRNELRGPGYFGIDIGVGKEWKVKESQALKFTWETFNVTNSVRMDAAASSNLFDTSSTTTFGKYSSALSHPRVMQFSLRYSF